MRALVAAEVVVEVEEEVAGETVVAGLVDEVVVVAGLVGVVAGVVEEDGHRTSLASVHQVIKSSFSNVGETNL